jgi:hypothetical protein
VSEPDLQEVPLDARNTLVDLADEEAASQVNAELTAAADVATQPPSSPELSQGAALKSAEDAVNRPSPEKVFNTAARRTPDAAIVIPDSPDLPAPGICPPNSDHMSMSTTTSLMDQRNSMTIRKLSQRGYEGTEVQRKRKVRRDHKV